MKKFLFLVLAMFVALSAYSQDRRVDEEIFRERLPWKHELRIGYGGAPIFDRGEHMHTNSYSFEKVAPYYESSLSSIYGKRYGDEYVTGVFSAEYYYHCKRWFSVGAYMGINGMWGKEYDPATNSQLNNKRGASVHLVPMARFQWVNSKLVRIYTGIGLGVYMAYYDKDWVFYPGIHTTPIGISIGRQVFFYAETSLGTATIGGNFGIGYRF